MSSTAMVLRIYTDQGSYFGDRTVGEVVIERAKQMHVLGASIFEATVGLGHSLLHRRHFLERERTIVIEIIDVEDRLRSFAKDLGALDGIEMITLQAVEMLTAPHSGDE